MKKYIIALTIFGSAISPSFSAKKKESRFTAEEIILASLLARSQNANLVNELSSKDKDQKDEIMMTLLRKAVSIQEEKKGDITIRTLQVRNASNCYLVSDTSGNTYVIDPSGSPNIILEQIEENDLTLKGYIITHGHGDHISALPKLNEVMPKDIYMERSDMVLFKKRISSPVKINRYMEDKKQYGEGDLAFTVIHTPGHSPGSVCLYFQKADLLFSGDTLFEESVGRTDLERGSKKDLMKSLKVLNQLPDSTFILPGHGNGASLQTVRVMNPFMKDL